MTKLIIDRNGEQIAIGIIGQNEEEITATANLLFNWGITDSEPDFRCDQFAVVWTTEAKWIRGQSYRMLAHAQETGLSKKFKKNPEGFWKTLGLKAWEMLQALTPEQFIHALEN